MLPYAGLPVGTSTTTDHTRVFASRTLTAHISTLNTYVRTYSQCPEFICAIARAAIQSHRTKNVTLFSMYRIEHLYRRRRRFYCGADRAAKLPRNLPLPAVRW